MLLSLSPLPECGMYKSLSWGGNQHDIYMLVTGLVNPFSDLILYIKRPLMFRKFKKFGQDHAQLVRFELMTIFHRICITI